MTVPDIVLILVVSWCCGGATAAALHQILNRRRSALETPKPKKQIDASQFESDKIAHPFRVNARVEPSDPTVVVIKIELPRGPE